VFRFEKNGRGCRESAGGSGGAVEELTAREIFLHGVMLLGEILPSWGARPDGLRPYTKKIKIAAF
jgi:hypothetical protein